jgi:ABC-type transport system involved in multi-copper enzyme maturation permease subunit
MNSPKEHAPNGRLINAHVPALSGGTRAALFAIWWLQIRAIIRLELKKTFFARRGLWIYLLALAPVALFTAQAIVTNHFQGVGKDAPDNVRRIADEDIETIHPGMSRDEVIAKLGEPYFKFYTPHREVMKYPSETGQLTVFVEDGKVTGTQSRDGIGFEKETYIFAGVFQFFFIRLAVFFGCLGIFMNLIRGEMLNRTLHYYLLAPVRRDVMIVGKYLAGLLAAAVIFTLSAALQIWAVSLAFDGGTIHRFLNQQHGFAQIAAYLAVTVLACVGYGCVFLAAGLLFKNPIIPAGLVLIWEAANPVLPPVLQKISIIYYLKSLCPLQIPVDPGMPKLLALLVSNSEPVSWYFAIFGLLAVSTLVLYGSCRSVRKLEINYTTE